MVHPSDKYINVSIHLKVDGNIIKSQEKTYYERGREGSCFTLEDFARVVFMYEQMFGPSTTYLMDGVLQDMEKKLPSVSGETADSLFQKYWVNLKQSINEDFEKLNKGEGDKKYALYPEEGDYLKYCIHTLCRSFHNHPMPVKYGFLYWLHTYMLNGSVEEYKADLDKVPQEIKTLVDECIVANKKPSPENKDA